MFAGLIIMIPVLLLVGFTIWALYRCREQSVAYLNRPHHPAVKVEQYEDKAAEAEDAPEGQKPCLEALDAYFQRGPMILSGRGGGWGLARHLTQVRRRHQHPVGSFHDHEEHW